MLLMSSVFVETAKKLKKNTEHQYLNKIIVYTSKEWNK